MIHSAKKIKDFQDTIWEFFKIRGRVLPWRETADPYEILVSEMMLQQTQVARVIPKYQAFLKEFPTVETLAQASLAEVLTLWVGLGYNRRARYLHQAAQQVIGEYGGVFPTTNKELQDLPGIGPYTASAISTFAYGNKEVLIETNVRAVYIHYFCTDSDNKSVSDDDLSKLIQATLPNQTKEDKDLYKNWYWALMDYGSYLKEIVPNPSRKSKHYSKQSRFKGSLREARGFIIRVLSAGKTSQARLIMLAQEQCIEERRLIKALNGLEKEEFIKRSGQRWQLVTGKV